MRNNPFFSGILEKTIKLTDFFRKLWYSQTKNVSLRIELLFVEKHGLFPRIECNRVQQIFFCQVFNKNNVKQTPESGESLWTKDRRTRWGESAFQREFMTSWRALEAPPPASTPKTYNPHYEDEDYHQHRDKWVPYSWIEPKKHYVRSYE